MALSQVGSAADEAIIVPPRTQPDDLLLAAIRRGLVPHDPVARLLAGWSVPPPRPVATHTRRLASPRVPEPA